MMLSPFVFFSQRRQDAKLLFFWDLHLYLLGHGSAQIFTDSINLIIFEKSL